MPFTPSHVAAVIPLISSTRVRRVLDPWALAVGSMVPDLPMFLPYLDAYTRWHSPIGIVTDDVAATFVLLALFSLVFRDPLTALLPRPMAARVAALPGPSWRRFPAIALGAAAGAATHVAWDSFTHEWGAAFWGWHWMTAPVFGWVPGYRLAQYICSVLGLAVIAWWAARSLRSQGTPSIPRSSGTIPVPPRSPEPLLAPPGSSDRVAVPSGSSDVVTVSPGSPRSVAAPLRSPGTATLPPRLAMPEKLRWGVLACTGIGACCAAAGWPLVDPPNPAFGWAHVVTRIGVGLVIGFCAVLTAYATLWHLTRALRAPRA
ncbi:DUF4184 family protein [Sphaerisporangium sp. NPDC051017]|uniref:DUF4184 family protein n=1 Tax=Sphaerisporangium sp. NPDC051017 TaxID=3154636 RepID=UPI003439941F